MFFLFPKKNIMLNKAVFAIVLVILAIVIKGEAFSLAVAIGFIVSFLPDLIFHKVFFVGDTNNNSSKLIQRAWFAIILKFLSFVCLFVLGLQLAMFEVKTFFIAFLLMQSLSLGGGFCRLYKGAIR